MALVTTNSQTENRGIVIYNPAQRQLALRTARRHSYFVRTLRLMFPVAAVALLASYGLFLQASTKFRDAKHVGTFKVDSVNLLATRPTMRNPTYSGVNEKDGSEFTVKAKRAITDLDESKPIDLFGISGRMAQRNGTVTQLTAKEGKFDRTDITLHLKNDIVVRTSDGMAARLSTATVKTKESVIISNTPVAVRFPAGTLHGNKMRVHQKTRDIYMADGVIARLNPEKSQTPKATEAKRTPATSSMASFAGQSDQPVVVKAPQLHVNDTKNAARFSSGVIATQGDARLDAIVLDVLYSRDATQGQPGRTGSGVSKIFARDNVVITRGTDRITTSLAAFDVQKNITNLLGDVVITSAPDRTITSKEAVINTATETVLLTGAVVATQGGNILRGSRLLFDQRTGKFQLTNPASPTARSMSNLPTPNKTPRQVRNLRMASKRARYYPLSPFKRHQASPSS